MRSIFPEFGQASQLQLPLVGQHANAKYDFLSKRDLIRVHFTSDRRFTLFLVGRS
jgi:hypothetical protein|tara:strand:- start:178 stop:342 length:165 start_codon:yes stop_codon:yes gene_type:complete